MFDLAPSAPEISTDWSCYCIRLAPENSTLLISQAKTLGSGIRALLDFFEENDITLNVTLKRLDYEADIASIREYAREISEAAFREVWSAVSGVSGSGLEDLETREIESSIMMLRKAIWNHPKLCESGKRLILNFQKNALRPTYA